MASVEALVLDAAPLLTQAPIAGIAQRYYIPPTVFAELRDARAREYVERLRSTGQIDLEVREPGAEAMHKGASLLTVMSFSRLTGDYAVLSQPDLHVLALTYALEVERHGTWRIRETPGGKTGQQRHEAERVAAKRRDEAEGLVEPKAVDAEARAEAKAKKEEAKARAKEEARAKKEAKAQAVAQAKAAENNTAQDDDEDDEETGGEWITPENITKHKNRSLGLVTDESVAAAQKKKRMTVACMTGDFAVQNVLLQMGMNLVSTDGTRIERVKSWVLRCHACFKYVSADENMQGQ